MTLTLVYARRRGAELRFEVLVRDGMVEEAMKLLTSQAKIDSKTTMRALHKALDALGPQILDNSTGGLGGDLMQSLWAWLTEMLQVSEDADIALEWLVAHHPQRILSFYTQRTDAAHQRLVSVLATNPRGPVPEELKHELRMWARRSRRLHIAANQAQQWQDRFMSMSRSLQAKSPLGLSVWKDLETPDEIDSPRESEKRDSEGWGGGEGDTFVGPSVDMLLEDGELGAARDSVLNQILDAAAKALSQGNSLKSSGGSGSQPRGGSVST